MYIHVYQVNSFKWLKKAFDVHYTLQYALYKLNLLSLNTNLIKIIQSFMKVGKHACRWLICDLNGKLQDPLHKTYQHNCIRQIILLQAGLEKNGLTMEN